MTDAETWRGRGHPACRLPATRYGHLPFLRAFRRLDKVSEPALIYPYWHQSYTAKDRLGEADLLLLKPYLGRDMTAPR